MSNHTNNTRHHNYAYARYINDSRVNFNIISPPPFHFPRTLNERVGIDSWLWYLPERNLTLPSSMLSFPRPRMQLVVFSNNVTNNTNMWSRPTEQSRQQHSELTLNEPKNALKNFKKEIFNPTPKKIIKRLGRFSRQNDATNTYRDPQAHKKVEEDDDDDDERRCAVCLEDFEAKEVVMVTPCNHMFHEDCILPWVKSNGKCPVCRFLFCGSNREESGESSTSNDNLVNDR